MNKRPSNTKLKMEKHPIFQAIHLCYTHVVLFDALVGDWATVVRTAPYIPKLLRSFS